MFVNFIVPAEKSPIVEKFAAKDFIDGDFGAIELNLTLYEALPPPYWYPL